MPGLPASETRCPEVLHESFQGHSKAASRRFHPVHHGGGAHRRFPGRGPRRHHHRGPGHHQRGLRAVGAAGAGRLHGHSHGHADADARGAGAAPAGITFTDNGNGTATFGGEVTDPAVAAPPPLNSYFLLLEASNGAGTPYFQLFEINVGSAPSTPSFASADSDTEAVGVPFSFTVNTYGYPAPVLTEKGHLPKDITFTDNGDGTATIASDGPDHQDGGHNGKSYGLDITATSSAGTVTQDFTLHITGTGASVG